MTFAGDGVRFLKVGSDPVVLEDDLRRGLAGSSAAVAASFAEEGRARRLEQRRIRRADNAAEWAAWTRRKGHGCRGFGALVMGEMGGSVLNVAGYGPGFRGRQRRAPSALTSVAAFLAASPLDTAYILLDKLSRLGY